MGGKRDERERFHARPRWRIRRFGSSPVAGEDARSGRLELVIKVGLPSEYEAFDIFAKPEGNGISGWVAATGKSYICGDIEKDPRYFVRQSVTTLKTLAK